MAAYQAIALEWWGLEQFYKLQQRHPDLLRTALSRLIQENEELRWTMVVSAYQDRQINLGKAAELLGYHELELRDRFIELGIPLRSGPADLSEAAAEVSAIRSWFATEEK